MRLRLAITFFLALVIVAVYGIWSTGLQQLRAQDQPTSPEVTGSITGTVRSTVGTPLPDVVVNLLGPDSYSSAIQTTTTNNEGVYRLEYLFTGIYRLQFVDPAKEYVDEYFDNASTRGQASDVAVVGNVVSRIDVELATAGGISGTVTMYDGMGPDTATVSVYPAGSTYPIVAEVSFDNSAHEHDAFHYTVRGLPAGDYWLSVRGNYQGVSYQEGYDNVVDLYYDGGTTLTVTAGVITPDIDIVLGENPNLASLSGDVTLEDGTPAPDVRVIALLKGYYGDFQPNSSTTTDVDGRYQLRTLEPGIYKVQFGQYGENYVVEFYDNAPSQTAAMTISLAAGQSLSDVSAVIARTGGISGTVTMSDGHFPTSARIGLYAATNDFQSAVKEETLYNSSGQRLRYLFDGLTPGVYRLRATAVYTGVTYEEFYPNQQTITAAQDIVVVDGTVTPQIDFVLGAQTTYAEVNGLIQSETSEPLSNVEVIAYINQAGGWQPARRTHSGSTGLYRLLGLWPGLYRVCFEPAEDSHEDECYDNLPWDEATTIELTAGEVYNGVDVRLSPKGRITGEIVTRGADQLRNSTISVLAPAVNDWGLVASTEPSRIAANRFTYMTPGLPTGLYRVKLSGYLDDDFFEIYYPNAPDVERAEDLTVTLGLTTTNVDFTVGDDPFDAQIAGLVTGEGIPLSEMRVDIFRRLNTNGDWRLLTFVHTDESGRYQIDGLGTGAYRVRFSDPAGGLNTIYYGNATSSESAVEINLQDGMIIPELHVDMVTLEYSGYTEYRVLPASDCSMNGNG